MPPAVALAALPEIAGVAGAAGAGAGAAGAAGGMGSLSSLMGGLGGSGGGASGMIGPALSGASGLIQSIQAAIAKKKANAAMPPSIDPRQAAFLSELNQKRKSLETGAAFGAGMNAVNSTNAATNDAIVRSTGGDPGSTIQGLLQSQRVANDGTNNVIAQGQGQQMQMNAMYDALNNKIAARTLQLQMQKSQQARAEWAQKKQTANQNSMAGITGAASSLGLPGGNSPNSPSDGISMPEQLSSITPQSLPVGADMADMPLKGNASNLDTSFLTNIMGNK